MPLREFRCRQCGEKFEELVQKYTEVVCPNCGSGEVDRLISSFGFRSSGASSAASSGCASCSGGSCSTCH
ncbi:MAG: zinc ribbon domain-containing protein [Firmicutes bacterium]|jgi:putative FmdB family regulatory protein|nr:zinc ribbon domain-containing protein [Bacillota bacterium]